MKDEGEGEGVGCRVLCAGEEPVFNQHLKPDTQHPAPNTQHPTPSYRGRVAPSPTGYLHLGHARTFFASPHSSGRPFSAETPDPSGPRHCGQFVSPAAEVGENESASVSRREAKRTKEILADGFTV